MIYVLALLPATLLTVAGYVVMYLAARSEGALRTFGRYLGFWAFALAGLVILGAIFAAAHGRHYCPFVSMHQMHEMHERAEGAWSPERGPRPETPPSAPPAAEPGTPPPQPPR